MIYFEAIFKYCCLGKGLKEDVTRRFPYYLEDFTDGYKGENTLSKVFATTFFLYFAVLLPALATGVLNAIFTQDKIGVYQVLLSEIIGGFSWTFLSGQPLVIISNTLVVAFYNKVIHDLAADLEVDFFGLYACSGLWGSLFLILYSIFNLSDLMKHLKKSIKDIYTTFVVLAFVRSAIANIGKVANFCHQMALFKRYFLLQKKMWRSIVEKRLYFPFY